MNTKYNARSYMLQVQALLSLAMGYLLQNNGVVSGEASHAGISEPEGSRMKAIAYLSLLLPVAILLSFSTLVFVSLTSPSLSAAFATGKLVLWLIAVSPVAYTTGLLLSLASLYKSDMKLIACTAVVLNATMLLLLAYCGRAFLTEFRLLGCL